MTAPDLERVGAGSDGLDGGSGFAGVASAAEGDALAEGAAPCDLLYAVPFRRIDVEGGVRALTFAFSSGDVGDTFQRLLDKSELAPSPFVPRDFADDIFLREFVARCLAIRVAGHERMSGGILLQRLVAEPPSDIAHTRFRQAIFRELVATPGARKQLEKLHGFLGQFRDLASRRGVTSSSGTELRLALLHSLRRIIELLSTGFGACRSGLGRLDQYGRQLAALPGFRRLCELLDYEAHRGEVDVRIRLGFDGHVRGFQALERRDNKSNAFYSTALGRFFTRLGFLLRGERVGTNEILSRLADHVFSGFEPRIVFFFQLLGDIEFYLAGLSFRDDARARGLEVCLPGFSEQEMPSYRALFNPLLAAEGMRCVPCDLELPGSGPIVLITGPNSGGKTRLLQSLALAQLLGQAGLFVPAARAEQPWVNGLFASLIDRMQPDQAEGRLGTELLRIRRLFEVARAGSMVLMDELCSGTNPSEGEELQELVLEMLGELPPRAFITTHFLQFVAQLAETSSGLRFLRAELDPEERPTYAFGPGVATTSLAHRVAERLGVTRSSLRELMRRNHPNSHSSPPRTSLVQPRASQERLLARAVQSRPR